ncbi:hypothetical protein M5689_012165 [Euphorbia peplus]|nr:hypothetical protein M5689_012165 [Euphorbia peplus]
MAYLNRACMAATMAVVQGHPDQGSKFKSTFKSLQHGKRTIFTNGPSSDLRPLSAASEPDHSGVPVSPRDNDRKDESLRQVMYLTCWGQG